MEVEFEAALRLWDARKHDSWTFADLPTDVADEIADAAEGVSRGFGSVRVEVTIGTTTWRTSIFPGAETYVLPLKAAVRRKESIEAGDVARIRLRLVDLP
ncbi:MAG: DUF1905 domain-containing protein [Cellulomonas sp.]|uniref:DUF1905 domain-containing protein n=1 Tax=Cellulomonas gelida TaxID=1712 RepID=A0A4Y3KIF1_9CELL|nr:MULTISPECIES: DUF1905 domain-containing protein [Cellulomonas]KMM44931.1 hypothetical protein CWIS_14085 [Cellulomonas sp. A375-1]MCR6646885.1 DUF1905 domain-containing protein [Cellulomonas sp.]GEA83164.1 hypothetical protein CGE01nite_04150 [Cellulomonas gelida]GGL29649.1 hypothetical protein GCM10009774_20030 [Cellulomonas gelida]